MDGRLVGSCGPQTDRGVVVGLSGGVDSAVAAALLKLAGYEPHGIALRLWQMDASESNEDGAAAGKVAETLGIPFEVVDLRERFYEQVVQPFAKVYAEGRTPNPCIMCNPTLKFAALLEAAERLGAPWIATGHYARVEHLSSGSARLLTARAEQKDQSYALYRLTQSTLQRLLLPLGEVESKERVRDMAKELGIAVADRRDSQDLCFAAGNGYGAILATTHPEACREGPILTEGGEMVGRHSGIWRYTIGQRSGLGIAAGERLYVSKIDASRNAIIVGPRAGLECVSCELEAVTFCSGTMREETFTTSGRVRYRARLTAVQVTPLEGRRALVTFSIPQVGVAPGQSLVFYEGDEVVGGGIIQHSYA